MIVYPSYVSLIFHCPKCNAEYSFMESQIKDKGMKWYCGCGEDMVLSRKKDDGLSKQMLADCPPFSSVSNTKSKHSQLCLECVSILVQMGFSKRKVKPQVEKLIGEGYASREKIVKAVLGKA
jgi:hypothetical protein